LRLCFAVLLFVVLPAQAEQRTLQLDGGETIAYQVVEPPETSARPVADRVLRLLAAGRIEDAALLSNAPKRRYEVLRDYMASVGEDEFRRVYARYLDPDNRVIAEIAVGPRRLIVWELGEAGHPLAGQFYVDIDGRFLMDDVPSEERAQLRKILNAYRNGAIAGATSPARTD